MTAVAYLRRSRVDARRDGSISHEQQLAAVRRLAEQHGDDPDEVVVIEDWGKSGRASKQHLRTGFAQLEQMVRDREATAVYAYSMNRLARSLEALTRLAKACSDAEVPIRCADGYSPDVSSATGRMVLNILGSIHEWQAEWTRERAMEATAVRRARGDHMGPAPDGQRGSDGRLVDRPGEDLSKVIEAWMAERTFQGTARRLTLQGVPTRRGNHWQASTVRRILRNEAPDLLPPSPEGRRGVAASFRLSGLLRCPHDDVPLTGRHETRRARKDGTTGKARTIAYACSRANVDPSHPHPRTVAESKVLPWIVEEVNRLRVPERVTADLEAEARRPELEARRDRVTDAFLDGTIDKVRRDSELLAIADELASLSQRVQVLDVPSIDWDWPPEKLNPVLRAVLQRVELGTDLLPVRAEWRIPEWRSP